MSFFLWALYWPLLKLLSLPALLVPKLRARREFELKNISEDGARSFSESGLRADFCFEFSSEGEYQQVASLVDDALAAGKRLELIFFSPSVEKATLALARKYPDQIRYLRYPLMTLSPFKTSSSATKWITADKLIMVRYDLFPEFLLWAMGKNHELTFLWTTFKKERVRKKSVSWIKRAFLRHAEKIIYASVPDQRTGGELGFPGPSYDFRMEQIRRRVVGRSEKFQGLFPQYEALRQCWETSPKSKRLIVGNAWPSDLAVLKLLPKDVFLLVVPHQLSSEMISAFEVGLKGLGRAPAVIDEKTTQISGDTLILNKKGVLCELYADFDFAYVGGGFGASVHSILEPLVAGSRAIACGPVNHRSTEFDVADSFGAMTEVRTAEDLRHWLEASELESAKEGLAEVFANYEKYKKDVLSC